MDWRKTFDLSFRSILSALLFVWVVLLCIPAVAGEKQAPLDSLAYERLVGELDYGEAETKTAEDDVTRESKPLNWSFDWNSSALGPVVLSIVIILLLALVIYLVLRHLSGRDQKLSAAQNPSYSIEDFDPEIPESDLDRFLRLALERSDYRAAVRIHFLMAIRKLSESQLIRWERDKTNRTYLHELDEQFPGHGFEPLTRVYEVIWFGEAPVNEVEYRSLANAFEDFYVSIPEADGE